MAGRPRREEDVAVMTLRIPHPLLERVNRCKALVELQEGANLSRTEVLWQIIEGGCRVLEGQVAMPSGTPGEISRILVTPDAPETSGSPPEGQHGSQVEAPARMRPRGTRRPLAAHITRIAKERAKFQYSRLTLDDFAKHLFDTGIYRTTAKDGTEQPVNRGTLQKWLKRAEPGPMAAPAPPMAVPQAPAVPSPEAAPVEEAPQSTKLPMIPTGMHQCRYGHEPYPMSRKECPTCVRNRK